MVRSARAKRIAMRVDPARGDTILVVPMRSSEKSAWKFAHKNRDWIETHLAGLDAPVPFAHDMVLPILGIERRIHIERKERGLSDITLHDDTLHVVTAREDPATNIRQHLTRMLEDIVVPMAHEKAARIDRAFTGLQLRDTRTRWGSCSPDGKMMLSWRLVFAPMQTIDYVVAHEVAHLRHLDHSRAFWSLARELSDDFTYGKHWLDINGDRLLRYGVSA